MSLDETSAVAITSRGAAELAGLIAGGDLSATEVVAAHLDRIAEVNGQLNAIVTPRFNEARDAAQRADAAQARGEPLGSLHGVPVTIKECFDVEGTDSTIGIDRLVGKPARQDSPLVARLRQAGAIVLGKTNVPQLMAMHESDNPVFGQTNNPWDIERGPGGSSGGEAAIIAAGGSPLGLGTDLGGSIRQPAHVCGISGIKPTNGRLTMAGSRNNFAGLDSVKIQPGPMARNVADLALAMRALLPTGQSPAERDESPVAWRNPEDIDVAGLRVAAWTDDGYFPASPAIRRAVNEASAALADRGAIVEAYQPPDIGRAMEIYTGLVSADGGACFARLLRGSRWDWRVRVSVRYAAMNRWLRKLTVWQLGLTGQHRSRAVVEHTGALTADEYRQLVLDLELYIDRFLAEMRTRRIDVLLFPPHALPAFTHGKANELLSTASYCYLINLLGLPAGTVAATCVRPNEESDRPVSRDLVERTARQVERDSAGLPVGVQVATAPWREDLVLAVMQSLEEHFRGQPDYPVTPRGV